MDLLEGVLSTVLGLLVVMKTWFCYLLIFFSQDGRWSGRRSLKQFELIDLMYTKGVRKKTCWCW